MKAISARHNRVIYGLIVTRPLIASLSAHCDPFISALQLWSDELPRKVTSNWRMVPEPTPPKETLHSERCSGIDGWPIATYIDQEHRPAPPCDK